MKIGNRTVGSIVTDGTMSWRMVKDGAVCVGNVVESGYKLGEIIPYRGNEGACLFQDGAGWVEVYQFKSYYEWIYQM